MAHMPNGILGGLVGSIGPVSGYLRMGKPVLRVKYRRNSYKLTPKREAQQLRMKLIMPFIQSFTRTGLFKKSFPRFGGSKTGYNLAVSHNMNMALTGTFPDLELSYPLVLISRGGLPKAMNATAVTDSDGHLHFGWEDNSDTGKAKVTDKVLLVAYFPEKKKVIYSLDAGLRSDCQATLDTSKMRGYTAETWIGFINEEETDAADSVYTGSIVI